MNVPSNKEIEAAQLVDRAEKKANSFSFFGGKSSNYEEASEMLTKAGNLYKIEKKWKEAGEAYLKSAEYCLKRDERDEQANSLVEASKCFKKVDPKEAVQCLVQAIDILKEKGRFHPAAGYHKQIAEIYEADLVDLSQAMFHYEQAAELYSGEDSSGLANQCWVKVATFAAQLEQYDKAIEKFEHVGTTSLENNLTKYSAKGYFLNAGLCHLCLDIIGAKKALERYNDMDLSFAQSREGLLLKNLVESFENDDLPVFTGHIAEFDRMTRLDDWKTTILLRIKKKISEEPSLT